MIENRNFRLNSVSKLEATNDETLLIVHCSVTYFNEEETYDEQYRYRANDKYGVAPLIRQWLEQNPNFPVEPYNA